ncbi:unnamed protein product [Chrysoparadoxa australica]
MGPFGRKVTIPSRQARGVGAASLANGDELDLPKAELNKLNEEKNKVELEVQAIKVQIAGVEAELNLIKAALTPGGDPYLGLTGEQGRDQLLAVLRYLMQKESHLRQRKVAILQASSVAPAAITP